MTNRLDARLTAFRGHDLLIRGGSLEVALAVRDAMAGDPSAQVLVFDDANGRVVDLDLRGDEDEIAARLAAPLPSPRGRYRSPDVEAPEDEAATKGRGRPRLGVVSREVTLLPRHWDWLAAQRGGASATLRRLVDEARRAEGDAAQRKAGQEAAYAFLQAIAGDLPGYEEAVRALFAGDRAGLEQRLADWPEAIRSHALRLAFGGDAEEG
ncbi:DUF2239 family protein [Salipiger sp. H15]|uniref:DUF2239 family protein n=1 Tax=Alloyangia sp. H15 TaxID=3029062 RepID=A0AAU8AEG1_9RHOB